MKGKQKQFWCTLKDAIGRKCVLNWKWFDTQFQLAGNAFQLNTNCTQFLFGENEVYKMHYNLIHVEENVFGISEVYRMLFDLMHIKHTFISNEKKPIV